ncbi:PD-(D/E)XK nuclease superfamily protein [Pseudoalteromonas phenolica]|uniref:PD-(D/E)XK nuclease superfamily protein n=1 Tax=Pseudoalteromonas phenolica TaxID=161398 RepID=UPI00384E5F1B
MEDQFSLFEEAPQPLSARTPIESNRRFCKELEDSLVSIGFKASSNTLPEPNTFNTRNSYEDMYGTNRQSSFLVNSSHYGLIRVEAHRQESSGSVDQKFPFFFKSLLKAPEHNLVIVFDGDGYKKEAYRWLLNEAETVKDKKFHVFDTKEAFLNWLKS